VAELPAHYQKVAMLLIFAIESDVNTSHEIISRAGGDTGDIYGVKRSATATP
jgi:hypothetical protein